MFFMYVLCVVYVCGVLWVLVGGGRGKDFVWMWCGI